ncbi:MAG: mevalonate kinase [Candidatus Micrarchaeia archaeon]
MEYEVKAPGVIKLLGEHAVVYGKLSLAMAIDVYASAKSSESGTFAIVLKDLGKSRRFGSRELGALYKSFMSRKTIGEYIAGNATYGEFLPFATVLAVASAEYGINAQKIVLHSNIPMQKGFASSAALSAALATSLLAKTRATDAEIVELARVGEIVMHKSEGAGKIDANASYYGGLVAYSQKDGARRIEDAEAPSMLAIDTGPKKSTAETVGHVAKLFEHEKAKTMRVLDAIEKCTLKGIEALKSKNFKAFGAAMYEDQEYLKKLGVSSRSLDKAVSIAKRHGAYGAKLSGGGGGGIAIAIDKEGLKETMEKAGFTCMRVSMAAEGAKTACEHARTTR